MTNTHRCLPAGWLLLVLMSGPIARADQVPSPESEVPKYTLRYKYQPGQTLRWQVLLLQGDQAQWGLPYREARPPAGSAERAHVLAADGTIVATVRVYLMKTSLPSVQTYLVPPPESGWHALQLATGRVVAYP